MADRGTVLHEIQSLEKQLDRLVPTIETLNTRLSAIEADVKNLKERIDALKCGDNAEKLNTLQTKLETTTVGLKKDLQALAKDIDALDEATDDIKSNKKEEDKVKSNRVWSIVEKFLSPAISAFVMWLIMRKAQGE
jgi:chromosome segregation ATPase